MSLIGSCRELEHVEHYSWTGAGRQNGNRITDEMIDDTKSMGAHPMHDMGGQCCKHINFDNLRYKVCV